MSEPGQILFAVHYYSTYTISRPDVCNDMVVRQVPVPEQDPVEKLVKNQKKHRIQTKKQSNCVNCSRENLGRQVANLETT